MKSKQPLPRVLIGVGLLLGSLLAVTEARAEDALTAEGLFRAGREAMESGDAATACDRFEESYRLQPAAGTALNLGNCRERLGQVATAWQRYSEAAQKLPPGDARVTIAKSRVKALEPSVPHLTLRAPAGSENWQVFRDGAELGAASLNLALPVDPGAHVIEVRSPGHQPWSQNLELSLSEARELELQQGAAQGLAVGAVAGAEPGVANANEEPSHSGRRTAGWVVGGVGVVGVATSLTLGAMVLSKKSTVNSECNAKQCSQAGLDAGDSGRKLSTASTIAFGVGIAALAVGGYLLLSGSPSKSNTQAGSSRAPHKQTRLLALTTAERAFVQLETEF